MGKAADQYLAPFGSAQQARCSVHSWAKVVCPPCGGVGADLGHVPWENTNLQSKDNLNVCAPSSRLCQDVALADTSSSL